MGLWRMRAATPLHGKWGTWRYDGMDRTQGVLCLAWLFADADFVLVVIQAIPAKP